MTRWLVLTGLFILYCWPRYFFVEVAGKGVSGFTLFAALLLLIALVQLVMQPGRARAFAMSIANSGVTLGLFALFWIWRLICDMAGISPAESLGATLLDFVYLGTWLISGAILFADTRLRTALPYVILLSGLLAAAFGVLELTTGTPLSTTLGFSEFQAGDTYTLQSLNDTLQRGAAVRIRSLFSHPIIYGQVMASMVPVALHFILRGDALRKVLGMLLAVAILVSISIANARSPMFVAAAAGAVYFGLFYLDPRRGSRLFVLLWSVIGLALVAPIATGTFLQIAEGRTSEEAISSSARDRQLEQGLNALTYRPITGYGDGNATDIAGILGRKNIRTVDNYYLTRAVDNGYPGVALFLVLLFAFVLKGLRASVTEPDTTERSLLCVVTATIAALALGLAIVSISDTLAFIFLMSGYLVAASSMRSRVAIGYRPPARANPTIPVGRPLRR